MIKSHYNSFQITIALYNVGIGEYLIDVHKNKELSNQCIHAGIPLYPRVVRIR